MRRVLSVMVQHLQVPAADLLGDRLEHLTAAQRLRRRAAADDIRLAPGRRGGFFEEELRDAPAARIDRIAIEQRHGSHDLRGADMKAHRRAMLDRAFHFAQAVEPNGDDPRSLFLAFLPDRRILDIAGVQGHRHEAGPGLGARVPGHPLQTPRRFVKRVAGLVLLDRLVVSLAAG